MGEIIVAVIGLLFVVIVLVGGLAIAKNALAATKPEVERPEYLNHLDMARWIDAQLRDDMVSCTISSPDKKRARDLLDAFYHEKNKEIR